jgi:hypothetical protein
MLGMRTFTGGCHCCAIGVAFSTAISPDELPVRACGCTFCLRHGAVSTSDPAGAVRFIAHQPAALVRYVFGLGTAEFWICGRCGVYVGAVTEVGGRHYACINVRSLDESAAFTAAVQTSDWSGEDAAARRARRAERWTPATVEGL